MDTSFHVYDNEDQILQDLIETNIRQRGDVGGSAKQIGRRIVELERIYGIEHGGDRKSKPNNSVLENNQKTQSDLADFLGMSVDTLQNYKLLAEMIPEMEELIDTGVITKTLAADVIASLTTKYLHVELLRRTRRGS